MNHTTVGQGFYIIIYILGIFIYTTGMTELGLMCSKGGCLGTYPSLGVDQCPVFQQHAASLFVALNGS